MHSQRPGPGFYAKVWYLNPPGYASVHTLIPLRAQDTLLPCHTIVPLHRHTPHFLSVPVGTTNSWSFCLLVQPDGQQSVAACLCSGAWYGDKTPLRLKVPKGTVGSVFVAGDSCTRA